MVLKERFRVEVSVRGELVDMARVVATDDEDTAFLESMGPEEGVNWGFVNALLLMTHMLFKGHDLGELLLPIQSAATSHLMRDLHKKGLLDSDSFTEAPF